MEKKERERKKGRKILSSRYLGFTYIVLLFPYSSK